MNANRLARIETTLGLLLAMIFISGCRTAGTHSVPGIAKAPDELKPVPAHVVLLAVKAQVANAIDRIEKEKNYQSTSAKDPRFERVFDIKKGTGVFSGTTQIVHTGGASIAAVIPFTGYADSKLKPKIGASGTATNHQFMSLTFELDPKNENLITPENSPELANVNVGTFVSDALVAYFNDAKAFATSPNAYNPKIKFNEIVLSATFTVVRKYEAGLGETIVMMPAPDLDSLGPTASGSRERTGIYKIELKFPLNVDSPPDPRRLAVLQPLSNGRTVSVEEPYTEERYLALTTGLKQPSSDPSKHLIRPFDFQILNSLPSAEKITPPDAEDIAPGSLMGPAREPRGL